MQRKGFIIFLLLFFPVLVFGQGLKIKGKVTDINGEPLLGANVMIAALSAGAATDFDGNYVFDVPSENVNGQEVELAASYIGFKQKVTTIVLRGNTLEVNFVLEEDVFQSEEIVVTGIASRTSKAVAEVSVARVSAKDLTKVQSYQGFSQLVAGKISGVQVRTSTGNVGGGWRFMVRGGGGLNGDEQPVIYIDGVRIDDAEVVGYGKGGQGISMLANLNAEDIENIEILKGPAASAMYGTGGSNGVVLITTKSGSLGAGKTSSLRVNYKFTTGYNEQAWKYDKKYFQTADAINDIFESGAINEHSISASGGSNFIRYYTSFTTRNEKGAIPNNEMDRKTFRANLTVYPTDDLVVKVSSGYNLNDISRPFNDNSILGYLGNTMLSTSSYGWTSREAIDAAKDKNDMNQFVGSIGLVYKPIKNFEVNVNAGLDRSNLRQDQIEPFGYKYGGNSEGTRQYFARTATRYTYDLNARYSYTPLENLNITSIVGAQILDYKRNTAFISTEKFVTTLVTDLGAGSSVAQKGESFAHTREAGLFTEHQFNYKNQYFLSLGIRKDYASSVGLEAPSIYYPKASFAVRLDKFNFLPQFVNLAKFRIAYGETGTLPESTDGIPLLWQAAVGGYGAGAIISTIGNSEIKPERIKEIEVGFDTELFGNLAVEFSYFRQNAENSIIPKANIPSSGLTASTVPFNVGGLKNWGTELLVKYNPIRTAEYDLSLTAIYNYQKSEITDLGGSAPIYGDFSANVIKEGLPKHQFYMEHVTGAKFDADGKYAGVVVSDGREDLGSSMPVHSGSFTVNFRFLKNFNFYGLAEFGADHHVLAYTRYYMVRFGTADTEWLTLRAKLGIQDMEGVQALAVGTDEYKAAAHSYAKLNRNYSGNFVSDADFLTIKELSLSYDFKDLLPYLSLEKAVKNLVAGVSVRNLYTTSKYKYGDVEVNMSGSRADNTKSIDFMTLQNPRTINFWLQVGF